MRKPVMAGNWKMYKAPAETVAFFEKFRPLAGQAEHCEVVICPPFTSLAAAVEGDEQGARRGLGRGIARGPGLEEEGPLALGEVGADGERSLDLADSSDIRGGRRVAPEEPPNQGDHLQHDARRHALADRQRQAAQDGLQVPGR